MTNTEITPEQKLTTLKHLAGGKSLQVVAGIMRFPLDQVRQIAQAHGYPDNDKLAWAVDVMEKNLAKGDQLEERPLATGVPTKPPARPAPAETPAVLTKPDEIRVLINTAKAHPAKRIQTQADRVLDAIAKLRQLIVEDEEKNREKRQAAAAKAAAKAEVERLEKELAAARAKLRNKPTPTPAAAAAQSSGATAAEIRAWAHDAGIDCPKTGRVPAEVRDQYDAAHTRAAS